MPSRGEGLKDPVLAKAFGEGFTEALAKAGSDPEWDVTVSYNGVPLRQDRCDSISLVLIKVGKAMEEGCSVLIEPVDSNPTNVTAEIAPSKDDDVVDAEIVS